MNGMYVYRGKEYSLAELSKLSGIKKSTLCDRLKIWDDVERAMNAPVRKQKKDKPRKKEGRGGYKCDKWNNDCFHCPLPDCNDWRPARKNELTRVPASIGVESDCVDVTYKILGFNRTKYWG